MKLSSDKSLSRQAIIYVIDHDEKALASLSSLLAPLNAKIEGFTSAESFLKHKFSENAACMLLEAHLQEVSGSGIDLLEMLVSQKHCIPTIIMASDCDVATAVRAIRASAIDFIEKPYVAHLLVNRVKVLLQKSRKLS